ncbi:MAG TPA: glycosyltransferase family 2 protein [Planctomycetota bacterium]|nr:glycosyltransferase family 2 protein [Planctomycetota bacterium]
MLNGVFILAVSVILIVWCCLHLVLSRALREAPFLDEKDEVHLPEPAPLVSVLIAARNEAGNIGRALESLFAQDYPNFEVLVVDDRSEDDTADIVREYVGRDTRLRLFRCTDLPEGWTGKNHALWQTVRHARGEILLFLDADVALDPGTLSVMVVNLIERRAGMLSLSLRLDSRSFWEKAVHLLIGAIILLRFPLRKVNDPDHRLALANGQIIMMRADAYHAVGGHRRVKSILLEDMALSRLMKREGHRPMFAYGFNMGSVRWYPALRDVWHGWSRVYYNVVQGSLPELFYAAGLLIFLALIPVGLLVWTTVRLLAGSTGVSTTTLFLLAVSQTVLMTWLFARLAGIGRCGRWYAATVAPTAVIALGIVCSGIVRRLTGGKVFWKGRHYRSLFDPPDRHEGPEPPCALVELRSPGDDEAFEAVPGGMDPVEGTEG